MGCSCAPPRLGWCVSGPRLPQRRRPRIARSRPAALMSRRAPFAPMLEEGELLFALSTHGVPSLDLLRHVVLFALDRPHNGDLPSGGIRRKGRRRASRRRRVRLKSCGLRLRRRAGVGRDRRWASSPPSRSRSVTLKPAAVATSAGWRKISDSFPMLAASRILSACSGSTSTVTALATVGCSWR